MEKKSEGRSLGLECDSEFSVMEQQGFRSCILFFGDYRKHHLEYTRFIQSYNQPLKDGFTAVLSFALFDNLCDISGL